MLEKIEEFEEKIHRINIAWDRTNQQYVAYAHNFVGLGVGVQEAKVAYIDEYYARQNEILANDRSC